MYEYYDKHVYELKGYDTEDYYQALSKIREWDYNQEAPIALGVFYKKELPAFEERFLTEKTKEVMDKDLKIRELLREAA